MPILYNNGGKHLLVIIIDLKQRFRSLSKLTKK